MVLNKISTNYLLSIGFTTLGYFCGNAVFTKGEDRIFYIGGVSFKLNDKYYLNTIQDLEKYGIK
jgi:hypothetical protein